MMRVGLNTILTYQVMQVVGEAAILAEPTIEIRGLPNKLIARRLQISEHTVKFHVSSIYAKLGASSRTDAVSRGVRRGFITL